MFGKRRPVASRNDRLVLVTEEHCGNLVEKYFSTLDRVEAERGQNYDDPNGEGFESLTEAVMTDGEAWWNEKYRSVYVKAVTPENVAEIVNQPIGEMAYTVDPGSFIDEATSYLDHPDDAMYAQGDFIRVTDEELRYLGYTDAEIRKARADAAKGDYGMLFDMWKEVWDPRYTDEDLYPRLEAAGIPRRTYDPEVNRYHGSHRGTFNRRRGRR